MKKLILTLGIFLAGIMFVNAQDKADAVAAKFVNKITEVCGLTPDQVAKLQPVAEDYIKTRKANKQQYATDPDGYRSATKTLNQNYKAQLKSILSPEQINKLEAYHTQQKANKQNWKGEQGENDGPVSNEK